MQHTDNNWKNMKNEAGVSMIEYIIIVGLIAIAAITFLPGTGATISGRFQSMSNVLNKQSGAPTAPTNPVITGTPDGKIIISKDTTLKDISTDKGVEVVGDAKITIEGTNNITAPSGEAGIKVDPGITATIADNGTDSFMTVIGYDGAAAIGGDDGTLDTADASIGNIVIDASHLHLTAHAWELAHTDPNAAINGHAIAITGAAIGTGRVCTSGINTANGSITINNGYIFADSTYSSPGIGCGSNDSKASALTAHDVVQITINGGYIGTSDTPIDGGNSIGMTPNGADIGGGAFCDAQVAINGGFVYAGTSGIKSGYDADGSITITDNSSNCYVSSLGTIGGGYGTSEPSLDSNKATVNILGGTVESHIDKNSANSSTGNIAAAIGGDWYCESTVHIGGNAHVNASVGNTASTSRYYQGAPAIGSGYERYAEVLIDGNAQVTAAGSNGAPGIGSAAVALEGTGVLVADSRQDNDPAYGYRKLPYVNTTTNSTNKPTPLSGLTPEEWLEQNWTIRTPQVTIGGSAVVDSIGGYYASGIGSGFGTSKCNVTIQDNADVTARGGNGSNVSSADNALGGAGIGSGVGIAVASNSKYAAHTAGTIKIANTAHVSATAGNNSMSIGDGSNNVGMEVQHY